MHQGERLADRRIAQTGEETGVRFGHRREVAANGLDEQKLRHLRHYRRGAGVAIGHLLCPVAEGLRDPITAGSIAYFQREQWGQCRQQRLQLRVATKEAAHHRATLAATAVHDPGHT